MLQILKITKNDDQITIIGFDDANPTVELLAYGWYSHTVNYYDPESYDENGSLKVDAVPREMTSDERDQYYAKLLADRYSPEVAVVTEAVLFVNTEAEAIVEQAKAAQAEAEKALQSGGDTAPE